MLLAPLLEQALVVRDTVFAVDKAIGEVVLALHSRPEIIRHSGKERLQMACWAQ